eukprot:TRINITY_DN11824_c0_g2_i1.p1 TRINITY_DN11824_c0_g2~~TRINITY_DN11824_c0_g2_i1.p1  ORF type:complete len:488 (-),score=64.42 TRINITY_DN11824_c0_g2_i1:632-2095(-)
MKTSADAVDGESPTCFHAARTPCSEYWADYLRDCQVSTDRYLAAQLHLTERLLHRFGVGQADGAAAACHAVLPRIMENQRAAEVSGDRLHKRGWPRVREVLRGAVPRSRPRFHQSQSQATQLSNATQVSSVSGPWALNFCANIDEERDQGISDKVYASLEGMLGSNSQVLRHVATVLQSEDEPERKGMIYNLVTSRAFEVICGAVIALNTIFIIAGANASMKEASSLATGGSGGDESSLKLFSNWTDSVEFIFLGFYTVELLLRLHAHRLLFFCCEGAGWNILDFVLVVASLGGLIIRASQAGGRKSSSRVIALRATRLIKIAKLLRVVRALRFFKQLHLFVDCVLGCLENLFWALIMILLVLLLFSIYFVQTFEGWISANVDAPDASEEVRSTVVGIKEQFGSVQMGMLTLSKAISGGADWADIFDVVMKTGYLNAFVFLSMIIFFVVAVWNIITSIFFENTIKAAAVDRDEEVLARRRCDIYRRC